MAAGTRRYEINLVVNTSQMTQAGQQANQVQQQVQQGATGVAGAIQQATNSITRYMLGIQGLRVAWGMATAEMQRYMELKQKLDDQQKSASEKSMADARALRQHIRNEGGFEHPERIPGIKADAAAFGKMAGFPSREAAIGFLTTFSSDVAQYIGDPGDKGTANLMNKEQGAKYRNLVGKSSVLSGVTGENANKVAGAILGSTDWNKHGNKGAATAYSQYERAMGIMSRGRGDINVNAKNYARLVNEMVQVDRSEGRITGDDALDKAAVLIREVSEYNPEESEVFVRNWAETSRMFGKKGTKEEWKKAGMGYDDPADAAMKAFSYFKRLKQAGKVPPGKTFIDWMRNDAKVQIRGAAGGQAIAMAEAKGLGKAAIESVAGITPDTAEKMQEALSKTDAAIEHDQAEQGGEAAERAMGAQTDPVEVARAKARELALAKGWFGVNDPRSAVEMGHWRKFNPSTWGGGEWVDTKKKSDNADLEMYRMMVMQNHPDVALNEFDRANPTHITAERKAEEYYAANPDARTRMLAEEIKLYEKNGQKVVDALEQLIKLQQEANRKAEGGVPANGQMGGMVPPH